LPITNVPSAFERGVFLNFFFGGIWLPVLNKTVSFLIEQILGEEDQLTVDLFEFCSDHALIFGVRPRWKKLMRKLFLPCK
jgi:hypothetical protein